MTSSRFSQVTDELLSAYIDDAVSAEERAFVEAALAAEPEIAWRLQSLRQTVELLHALPAVALPRSFVLTELPAPLAPERDGAVQTAVASRHPAYRSATGLAGFWREVRVFWSMGNPLLRNAAAMSFALFLLLAAGDYVFSPALQPVENQRTALPPVAALNSSSEPSAAKEAESPPTVQAAATIHAAPPPTASLDTAQVVRTQQATMRAPAKASLQTRPAAPSALAAVSNEANSAPAAQAAGPDRSAPPGPDDNDLLGEGGPAADEVEFEGAPAESVSAGLTRSAAIITNTKSGQSTTEEFGQIESPLSAGAQVAQMNAADEAAPARSAATATLTSAVTATAVITPAASPQGTRLAAALNTALPPGPNAKETGASRAAGWSIIALFQILAALLTLVLAGLWWRSRNGALGRRAAGQ